MDVVVVVVVVVVVFVVLLLAVDYMRAPSFANTSCRWNQTVSFDDRMGGVPGYKTEYSDSNKTGAIEKARFGKYDSHEKKNDILYNFFFVCACACVRACVRVFPRYFFTRDDRRR